MKFEASGNFVTRCRLILEVISVGSGDDSDLKGEVIQYAFCTLYICRER